MEILTQSHIAWPLKLSFEILVEASMIHILLHSEYMQNLHHVDKIQVGPLEHDYSGL